MADEEISFDETPADKVVTFFGTPIKEAVKEQPALPGPEQVDDLAESPMAWNELCEGMLRELHICAEKRKFFKDREDELKTDARKFIGKERGMIQRGAYGVEAKDVNYKGEVDYKSAILAIKFWARDLIGEEADAKIDAIIESQRKPSFTTVKLVPYRVGKEPTDD